MLKKSLTITTILFLTMGNAFAHNTVAEQNKINSLKQAALYYYWNNKEIGKEDKNLLKGIKIADRNSFIEEAFKEASKINNNDLSLQYALASAQLGKKDIKGAIATYQNILKVDKDGIYPNLANALYSKVEGDNKTYNDAIAHLKKVMPSKEYVKIAKLLKYMEEVSANEEMQAPDKIDNNTVIVITGGALNDKAEVSSQLLLKLEKSLPILNKNPKTKIILTGSGQKQGLTQAYVMKQWLVAKGVDQSRIILEDKARDSVEQANNSIDIISNLKAKTVIVVANYDPTRKTSVAFKARSLVVGIDLNVIPVAIRGDKKKVFPADKIDMIMKNKQMIIYKDALRAYGLWAFPGMQQ